MKPDEMTVRQAAKRLGVTHWRVYALIRKDQLPAEQRLSEAGDVPYYALKREDVERLAEERRKMAAGEIPSRGVRPKAPPEE